MKQTLRRLLGLLGAVILACSVAAPAGATANGRVLVNGGFLTVDYLTLKGSTNDTTFSSAGDFAINTNKFTVAGSSGNTVVAGTLTLSSASDIAVNTNKFTVAASSGNTVVGGTLTLGSGSDIAVNTNKFTVAASSGNTVVGGTLTLGSGGNIAVNTNKFTVTASSGNTVVAGTLGVTGATTLTGAASPNGGVLWPVNGTAKTTTYTVLSTDYTVRCDPTGGAFTVTLPVPTGNAGQVFVIKNSTSSTTAITVKCATSGTFDATNGQTTGLSIAAAYGECIVQSDGTNYLILKSAGTP